MTIAERVLLLYASPLGGTLPLLRTNHSLHFGAVDQARDVRIRNQVGWQQEILLESTGCGGATVDCIQCRERCGRPHDEPTEMATGSELQQIQREDAARLHTRDISERLDQILPIFLRVVNNQGPTTLTVTTTAEFSLAGAQFARFAHFGDVRAGTDGFEELDGGFGFGDGEGGGVDYEGDFGDGGNAMAAGLEKGGDRRGGKGGCGCETSDGPSIMGSLGGIWGKSSLLPKIDLLMPFAPDLGGGEHAAGTTHVAESSLTGSMGSSAGHTRDTSNSASCEVYVLALRPSFSLSQSSSPYLYPMTRQMFDGQLSRSLRMAVACSLPFQSGHSYDLH